MAAKKKAPARNMTTVGSNATNGNLKEGARMAGKPRKRRDLADIAGSWKTDKAIQSALADQDLVDEDSGSRSSGESVRPSDKTRSRSSRARSKACRRSDAH
jgi:hypothetical protein